MRVRHEFSLLATIFLYGASPAQADTFGAQLSYIGGKTDLDGAELSVPALVSEPGVLSGKNPRLRGSGTLSGVALRGDFLADAWRFGLGTSLYGVSDTTAAFDSLAWGVRTRTHSLWGTTSEVFVGQEIGQGPIYPYLDLRLALSVVQVQVEVDVDPHGHAGTGTYNVIRGGVGPRFGALIPVGHSLMVDVSAYHQLVGGIEQVMFGIGVGYWENDRRDPFSEALRGSWRGDF